jgi:hypothetical protein
MDKGETYTGEIRRRHGEALSYPACTALPSAYFTSDPRDPVFVFGERLIEPFAGSFITRNIV